MKKSRSNQKNLSSTCFFFYIEEMLSITENGFSKNKRKTKGKMHKNTCDLICKSTDFTKKWKETIDLRCGKC